MNERYIELLEWLNDNHLDVALEWWKHLDEKKEEEE